MGQPYPIFNPQSDDELLRGWLVHAHKCRDRHDPAARRCDTLRYAIGVPTITLSAIVGTSVFSTLGAKPEAAAQGSRWGPKRCGGCLCIPPDVLGLPGTG